MLDEVEAAGVIVRKYVIPKISAIKAAGGRLDIKSIFNMVEKYPGSPEFRELLALGESNAK